ncbi:hypothetical protein F4677DRAFT_410160 [Hypoxylon crocopeplum]|nr:hypothetical protein F4677DRAFT_410160 [Hypoxylon crocopeplum]
MGNPTEAAAAYPPNHNSAVPPPYSSQQDGHNTYDGYDVPTQELPSYAAPRAGESPRNIAGVSNRFPQSLNAYFVKNMFSKNFHLGEHSDNKLFAVTMHSGWTSKPLLELHAGPTDKDPVMATAENESKWGSGKKTLVEIIPSAVGQAWATAPGSAQGQAPQKISMQQQHNWKHVTHPFSVEVGLGKDVRREDFEWRRSRGGEVQSLDKHAGYGFKLVRLSSSAVGQGGERASRSEGATSDGKEVVAAWSYNSSWSASKVFKFQYLESGATGVLGDSFALAALMTALKIWYMEYLMSQSAVASGAGA